jgi:hypothetical protein
MGKGNAVPIIAEQWHRNLNPGCIVLDGHAALCPSYKLQMIWESSVGWAKATPCPSLLSNGIEN